MQRKTPAIIGLFLLAGCTKVLPPEPPPPHAGAKVRVWATPTAHDLIRSQAPRWLARQRAVIESVPDAADADVWVIPPCDIARLASSPPVPDSLTRRGAPFDWNGLLPLYREQLCRADGRPVSVPLTGEALVCVYRSDLFASHQAKYAAWREAHKLPALPLRPPLSWAEFRDQAAFFAETTGRPSLAALPTSVEGLDRLFYAIAAPHARRAIRVDEEEGADHLDEVFFFHYDRKTGRPRLDSPGFIYGLTLLRDYRRYASADPRALAAGEVVLGLIEAGEMAALQRVPSIRDRIGVCPIPGADRYWDSTGKGYPPGGPLNSVPYLGGAGLVAGVSPKAGDPVAAWDLLAELAGPMRSTQAALEPRWGGGPTRTTQLLRDRWDSFALDGPRSQALRESISRTVLQHGIKNPVLVLRTADQAAKRAALHRALVEEKGTPEEALKGAARAWEVMDQRGGKEKAMAEYRRSLGLTD